MIRDWWKKREIILTESRNVLWTRTLPSAGNPESKFVWSVTSGFIVKLKNRMLRVFISSVQNEFARERQMLYDYLLMDALLGRFFEPFIFEKLEEVKWEMHQSQILSLGSLIILKTIYALGNGLWRYLFQFG